MPLPADILERVRARESAALALFYERYFDHVYSLAVRLMGERALAEDVTQDVFLKVWRAAPGLDPARDPEPWLTAITCNACRDVWRSGAYRASRSGRAASDDPELGVVLSSGRNDPEADALESERERLVQRALSRLPEALRVPIVLHDFQGLGHAEIGRVLGIDHAAARKRYSRAVTALAAALRPVLG
ncbi:MAG: RNA polymerase sigma factor [Candidatus Eiseniibacteriota bacterium]